MDTAKINLINHAEQIFYVYHQFVNCEECPLHQIGNTLNNKTLSIKTYFDSKLALSKLNKKYIFFEDFNGICHPELKSFYDQDVFNWTINQNFTCSLEQIKHGRSNLLPVMFLLIIYSIVFFVFFNKIRSFLNSSNESQNLDFSTSYYEFRNEYLAIRRINTNQEQFRDQSSQEFFNDINKIRFRSVDVFRGITIFLMIFVNYGAGEFEQLKHAPWNGLHFADLIFPYFIFIMGVSIAISMKDLIVENSEIFLKKSFHIFLRSSRLFLLGLIVNSCGNPDLSTLRIPGVLQRFSLSYGLVAWTHLLSKYVNYQCRHPPFVLVFQFFPFIIEFLLGFSSLIFYLLFTLVWRFNSDCPVGYTGPGGLGNRMQFINCTAGAARYLDELLIGRQHSYKHFVGAAIYDPEREFSLWHDPEGVLGTSTSILLTLCGLAFGCILLFSRISFAEEVISNRRSEDGVLEIGFLRIRNSYLLWTLSLFFMNLGFFYFSRLIFGIPINKQLWSLSFVLISSSTAILTLFILNFLTHFEEHTDDQGRNSDRASFDEISRINEKRFRNFIDFLIWPFECAGKNSILLYVGHEIVKKMLPFTYVIDQVTEIRWGHVHFMARNLIGATFWVIIAVWCHSKKLYFKV